MFKGSKQEVRRQLAKFFFSMAQPRSFVNKAALRLYIISKAHCFHKYVFRADCFLDELCAQFPGIFLAVPRFDPTETR